MCLLAALVFNNNSGGGDGDDDLAIETKVSIESQLIRPGEVRILCS